METFKASTMTRGFKVIQCQTREKIFYFNEQVTLLGDSPIRILAANTSVQNGDLEQ